MNTLYDAQAHIDELRRRADQERLARQSRGGGPTTTLVQDGRQWLGQALIWLGSRLREPVCEPVNLAVVSGARVTTSATLSLNEAACC